MAATSSNTGTGNNFDPDDVTHDQENITLTSFIMRQTRDHNLAILMNAIQLSCKSITRAVRKAGECCL
jgi:hypothetical protein